MILKLVVLVCCLTLVQSRPCENEERGGNVHGHIVRVNEAHDDNRRGYREDNSIEEDIVAVNEDPNNRPGCRLFEGDLCLDREDEAVVNQETDLKRNIIKNSKKLWPRGTVYYSVDQNLKHLRPKIGDAINTFHDKTCLKFREVDTSYRGDHIKMFKGNGCWSKVGRSGGSQSLSLGSGCEYVGVVLHELMHSLVISFRVPLPPELPALQLISEVVLAGVFVSCVVVLRKSVNGVQMSWKNEGRLRRGIWHEQSRPDRDSYVEILWQNIKQGNEKNFLKYEHGKIDTLGLNYDYASVMHYDRYLYSVDGKKPTIIARGRPWVRLGGQLRGTLTSNDVKEINALYDC